MVAFLGFVAQYVATGKVNHAAASWLPKALPILICGMQRTGGGANMWLSP